MKFTINITKEVIDKSLMCGNNSNLDVSIAGNCALAVALKDLIPNTLVGGFAFDFRSKENMPITSLRYFGEDVNKFIMKFDDMKHTPQERYSLVGQSFEVDIPQEVIDYYYSDVAEAAQKIINSEILQLVEQN